MVNMGIGAEVLAPVESSTIQLEVLDPPPMPYDRAWRAMVARCLTCYVHMVHCYEKEILTLTFPFNVLICHQVMVTLAFTVNILIGQLNSHIIH